MNPYLTFRKLHRVLVLVICIATLVMMGTGVVLKYPQITNIIPVSLSSVRTLHNTASPLFSIVLFLMMLSGVVMYFYPIIVKRKKQ
jgi:uncharacterized iron-regulated membrane protein